MPSLLVLGGARSGKSRYAEGRLAGWSGRKLYLATAEARDAEMAARIAAHRSQRADAGWETVEEPLALTEALAATAAADTAVLVDCLTLWLGNLFGAERSPAVESARLVSIAPDLPGTVVFVSNEVGLGIVPDNALARRFRDAAGRLHQDLAAVVDEVVFVAAGLPLTLKSPCKD